MSNKNHLAITLCALMIAGITSFVSIHYARQYRYAFFDGMEEGTNETAYSIVDQKRAITALVEEFCGEVKFSLEMLPVPTENYVEEIEYYNEDFSYIDSEERWN